jgi:hypothetical protein
MVFEHYLADLRTAPVPEHTLLVIGASTFFTNLPVPVLGNLGLWKNIYARIYMKMFN